MRGSLMVAAAWFALLGFAWAGPLDVAAAGARSATPTASRSVSDRARGASSDDPLASLDVRVRLELPPVRPTRAPQRIHLRLGALPPATLSLRVRLCAWAALTVSADLDSDLPRLDALDGETYWCPGLELRPARGLSVFVEDFQPASAVTGGSEGEPAPQRSWDGHQIAVGLRLRPASGLRIEGATVLYALSASGRAGGVGATLSLTLRY
ncbi:MAG: hypothetical protein D6731_04990 [Planctomycetota bacterium]|nr:MAG: hypothetical protein D6731_04990 [Planctomycetota bacterium]